MGLLENLFKKNYTDISSSELNELLKSKNNYQFIDVRTKGEYQQKKIKGFNRNLDYYKFARNHSMLQQIRKDKPIVIVCQTGSRSRATCKLLDKLGFTDIYNVKGGLIRYTK